MERLDKKHGILCRLRENRWVFLAFLIPMFSMIVAMAVNGIYPFGNRLFLYSDAPHQYFPFMLHLRDKLQTGESLLYTWSIGLGDSFWPLVAYYCSSPLNLLTLLVPDSWMVVVYCLLVAVKLGLAGLCCAVFLKKVFGRNDPSLAIFGSMYGLCGFAAGYYWNIMWLDTFALLPLVMLATWALVKEGKFRMYVLTLFLSLWCNYLMGLYVCIFVFFSFFTLCISLRLTVKQILGRLVKIGLSSVLALAMATVLLAPTLIALMQTTRSAAGGGSFLEFNTSVYKLLGNYATGMIPTWRTGSANIYTSLPAALLAAVYFVSKRIPKRQKLCTGFMLVFLLLSFWISGLEMIWNMMRKTNMLPTRFCFLFSFVLIVAAYQAVPLIRQKSRRNLLAMSATAVFLLAMIALGYGMLYMVINAAVLVVYGVLFTLWARKNILPKLMPVIMSVLLVAEMTVPLARCIGRASQKGYDTFPGPTEEVAVLKEAIDAEEQGDFYRLTVLPHRYFSDSIYMDFHGVSLFTSILDVDMIDHMRANGVAASTGGNRYYYPALNSPLNSAMLGLDYVIYRDQEKAINDGYLELIGQQGKVAAYKNHAALSVGFMASDGMKEPNSKVNNPFKRQNKIFTSVTGIEDPLYTVVPLKDAEFENLTADEKSTGFYKVSMDDGADKGTLRFTYEMPRDGLLYGYVFTSVRGSDFKVNGASHERSYNPYIFCIGRFEKGEETVITWEQSKASEQVMVYAGVLEEQTFAEGLEVLADEQLQVTSFDESSLTGTIEVKQPGYFYTSIPYNDGWTMYVDGKETAITPYQDAMIALEDLQPGTHTIELRFSPVGFRESALISAAAWVIFIALCVIRKKKPVQRSRQEEA